MANRKQNTDKAVAESEQIVKEREAAASTPAPVKPSGAARRRRMRSDAQSRRQSMIEGVQSAKITRAKDTLDSRAMDMVNAHAASLAEAKRKNPDVQGIQELEPMTLETARRQVATQGQPKIDRVPMVTPTSRGSKLTKAKSYGDNGTVVPKRRDPRKK